MRHGRTLSLITCVGLAFLIGASNVWAQQDAATLTGEVRDSSGAVVSGALVTVINVATNIGRVW
jgi:hypothetical protein